MFSLQQGSNPGGAWKHGQDRGHDGGLERLCRGGSARGSRASVAPVTGDRRFGTGRRHTRGLQRQTPRTREPAPICGAGHEHQLRPAPVCRPAWALLATRRPARPIPAGCRRYGTRRRSVARFPAANAHVDRRARGTFVRGRRRLLLLGSPVRPGSDGRIHGHWVYVRRSSSRVARLVLSVVRLPQTSGIRCPRLTR